MTNTNRQGPKYATAERVGKRGEGQSGRVQSITFDAQVLTFRYIVKWDLGPTTSHLENELTPEPLPSHYP